MAEDSIIVTTFDKKVLEAVDIEAGRSHTGPPSAQILRFAA